MIALLFGVMILLATLAGVLIAITMPSELRSRGCSPAAPHGKAKVLTLRRRLLLWGIGLLGASVVIAAMLILKEPNRFLVVPGLFLVFVGVLIGSGLVTVRLYVLKRYKDWDLPKSNSD